MNLTQIAHRAHVDPKTARRRLRELKIKRPGRRWEFQSKDVRRVIRLIKD